MSGDEQRRLARLMWAARQEPDESKGPVILCRGCFRSRIQWNPFDPDRVCEECEGETREVA